MPPGNRGARAWTAVLDENRGATATTFDELIDSQIVAVDSQLCAISGHSRSVLVDEPIEQCGMRR